MKQHKIVLDNKRIYNNGMAASVKGVVYEIEPMLAELAKQISEGVSLVVELKIVGKKKGKDDEAFLNDEPHEQHTDEDDELTEGEIEVGVAKNLDDPFENVKAD